LKSRRSGKCAQRRRFAGDIPDGYGIESTGAQRRTGNSRKRKKYMQTELEKVQLLARDLRDGREFPRSPRATLGGYVLAARLVDKCRAVLVGWQGEYHSNCPLDQRWLNFTGIDYAEFRSFIATGAADDEIAEWIGENAKKRPRVEIVVWNNKERDLRLSDLPPELQEYMENYIERYVPRNRVVYHWFDVYDLEEQRI
jgi:Domain of unknown function (DUF5069)